MCDIVYFMTQGEAGERIALACPKKLGFHQHHTSMMDLQSNEKKVPSFQSFICKVFFPWWSLLQEKNHFYMKYLTLLGTKPNI